jgi:hypothetical protein
VVGSLRSREAARPVLPDQFGKNGIATQQEPARTSVVIGFHGNPIIQPRDFIDC